MNKDIRLKVTFPNHKKTVKLISLIGYEGFYSLIQLWCYTAQNHPKGVLKNYDREDLEIAARWSGEKGLFARTILKKEISFVKKTANGFEINDWEEHNPYVFHAEERSEKARNAAKARWEPNKDKGLSDASSIPVAMQQAELSNAPSPSPSPIPKKNKKKTTIPENFSISERVKKWSIEKGHSNLDEHLENFILKANAKEYKYVDWDSAFMGAIRDNWANIKPQAKDYEVIVDGESVFLTESEFKQWKAENGRQ